MKNLIHIFSLLLIIISCNIDEVYIDVFDPEQSRLDSLNQRLEDKNLIFSYFDRNGILSYDTTQRGVFYSVIDAANLESIACRKSLFSRDYDPCSQIYETTFLDVGSRFELYGSIISGGAPWSGYMMHSTPVEEKMSLVHIFPVRVQDQAEFLVILGVNLYFILLQQLKRLLRGYLKLIFQEHRQI